MSNQEQTRILAATQLQLDKKRDLRVLSRASAGNSYFDHEQERQITIKFHHQQTLKERSLITRHTQNYQKSNHNQERLIAAQSLQTLKHRQESILNRVVPQNNDELDLNSHWWLTPSVHRVALNPSNKPLKKPFNIFEQQLLGNEHIGT